MDKLIDNIEDMSYKMKKLLLGALSESVACKQEVVLLKEALRKISDLNRRVDGGGNELSDWYAGDVCFDKAQRIAELALNLHKLRAD